VQGGQTEHGIGLYGAKMNTPLARYPPPDAKMKYTPGAPRALRDLAPRLLGGQPNQKRSAINAVAVTLCFSVVNPGASSR